METQATSNAASESRVSTAPVSLQPGNQGRASHPEGRVSHPRVTQNDNNKVTELMNQIDVSGIISSKAHTIASSSTLPITPIAAVTSPTPPLRPTASTTASTDHLNLTRKPVVSSHAFEIGEKRKRGRPRKMVTQTSESTASSPRTPSVVKPVSVRISKRQRPCQDHQ